MGSVRLDELSYLITQKLEATVETINPLVPVPVCKPTSALLSFAARHGEYVTLDTLLHVLRTSEGFVWNHVLPALFNETSPLTIVLVSPYANWHTPRLADRGSLLARWATVVSEVPYTEEIGRSAVDVLLNASMWWFLRPHIPIGIWGWLEKRPSLPPECRGRMMGGEEEIVCHVRALRDIKILKSYLLLIWSEWDSPWPTAFPVTRAIIREDFGGAEMGHHRKDLIEHLDRVLAELDRGFEYLRQQKPRLQYDLFQEANKEYRRIREVLLEVDRGAQTRARLPELSPFWYADPRGMCRIRPDLHVHFASVAPTIPTLNTRDRFRRLTSSFPRIVVPFPYTLSVTFVQPPIHRTCMFFLLEAGRGFVRVRFCSAVDALVTSVFVIPRTW